MKTILLLFTFSILAVASPELDQEYGYRSIAAVVTNVDKEPVYGEQVENEIVGFLRNSLRFEFSDKGYILLRDKIRPIRAPMAERAANTMLAPLQPVLKELNSIGVATVLLGEVAKDNDGNYVVVLQLATTKGSDSVFNTSVLVENGNSLESFTKATREGLSQLVKWLPFDATVIRRDGYLVVLDRGGQAFQKGQQLNVYTVERHKEGVYFEESGVIGLTRVDENIAFGRILVERRPLEVTVGNKIRLDNRPQFQVNPSLWSSADRDVSSISNASFEVTKGKFGIVGASLGPSIVTYNTKTKAGAEQTMNSIYPSTNIAGEVWLTSRLTFGLQMKYGFTSQKSIGGTTNEKVSSTLGGFRVLGGYRINLLAPEPGPILHFRLGYGKDSYTFDSTSELIYTSTTYSGILLGGGVTFPVNDRYGLGFDIETMIFPGVTEEPYTSGNNKSNVSAWDFVMKGYYRFDKDIDLEGRFFFQRNGAVFSGSKTRSLDYVEASQISKGFTFGISYYF